MTSEAATFLEQLFGYKPDETWILIWAKRGDEKVSRWCATVAEAAETVAAHEEWDVYYGVSLASEPYGPHERLKGEERPAAGIVGLWADIDLAGPEHATKRYPKSLEDADRLIAATGYPPTTVTHSGHGIQPIWGFKEPWIFDSTEERETARRLLLRWKLALTEHAAALGFAVDPVFDLERVLRVPGTTNWKSEPVPARILRNAGPVWSPSDFDERLPELKRDPFEEAAVPRLTGGGLVLRRDATPPFEKFYALQTNDPKFKQTVERKRRDLSSASASEYDLSLAGQVMRAGWSDQEVADLLIFCRRQHSDDLKLRDTYYEPTILKARSGQRHEEAVNTLAARAPDEDPANEDRGALLETISQALQIGVLRVVKITGDEPQYALETEKGTVGLGPIQSVMSQERFAARVCAATEHVIPAFKAPRWRKIVQALADAAEFEDAGPEATGNGVIRGWLADYLDKFKPGEKDAGNLRGGIPVEDEGRVYVNASHLQQHLLRRHGEKVSLPALAQGLRRYGAERTALHLRSSTEDTTRSYWLLPDGDSDRQHDAA